MKKLLLKKFEDKKIDLSTKQDVNDFKVDLVTRIESSKSDTIKWIFIFWIGQLAATTGILFSFLNVYSRNKKIDVVFCSLAMQGFLVLALTFIT